MSNEQRPLQVTVVSDDTTLLHSVSWLLSTFGYEVQTTKDLEPDAFWRRYALTDFVILDGRAIGDPCSQTFACDSDNPLYRIFLYDQMAAIDFAAWYATGADDAVSIPVSRGELLARIRAGARYLEFELRLKKQSSRNSLPGLLSKRGFQHKLQKLAKSSDWNQASHTLTMTSIDWYSGIRSKCGQTASRRLVAAAARAIKRVTGENTLSAYWGEGCIATLHTGQSQEATKKAADILANEFRSRESQHESVERPTLTIAIAPWNVGDRPELLISTALETLKLAKQSGGDCVLEQGVHDRQWGIWQNEMATGNPFTNVTAQAIMEPFPTMLLCDADQTAMIQALQRSGVPVCPYVDETGRLVGVASAEKANENANAGESNGPAALPICEPEIIPHDATFSAIYEAFSTRECSTLVVVADGRPLGYLTCEGFLSLIEPIHSITFASSEPVSNQASYLIVPSTTSQFAPA